MRGAVAVATVGMIVLVGCGSKTVVSPVAASVSATSSGGASATAVRDLTNMREGNCAPVAARFDKQVAASLSATQLCAAWITYTIYFGTFTSSGIPKTTQLGADTVVQIPLMMSKMPGEFRVTYENRLIAGIYELKTGVPL